MKRMETSYGKKLLRQTLSNLQTIRLLGIHSLRFRGGYSDRLSENSLPYGFDVKYDLRHKARLVAGGNWTVNDKEYIYSGVVRMDTVRIGFFLGELYGLSCCACDIGNAFLYGKTNEKVYMTSGTEFGLDLYKK
jgi:hypothetical protein